MRNGWRADRGAAALGYTNGRGVPRATSFSKGVNPALEKISLLRLLNPILTELDLAEAMKRIPPDKVAAAFERLRLHDESTGAREPGTDEEWELRWRLQTGRADRRELVRR